MIILETNTLPQPLMKLVNAEKVTVTVSELSGAITLMPIAPRKKGGFDAFLSLRGSTKDCGFTVDEFLARKREDKELELAADERRQQLLRGEDA